MNARGLSSWQAAILQLVIEETSKGKAPEVYNIGDSNKVGDIKEAVWTANEVARKI